MGILYIDLISSNHVHPRHAPYTVGPMASSKYRIIPYVDLTPHAKAPAHSAVCCQRCRCKGRGCYSPLHATCEQSTVTWPSSTHSCCRLHTAHISHTILAISTLSLLCISQVYSFIYTQLFLCAVLLCTHLFRTPSHPYHILYKPAYVL